MTFQQGNRLSDLKYNDNRYLKKSGTTQIISGDIIITGGVTGISLPHGGLTDMPDTYGIVSDHDARLATKVDPSEPTIPVAYYTGMLWFDTDDDSSVGGGMGATGLQGAQGITGAVGIGTTGLSGITGYQGLTGLRGITGAQGITGIQGVTGLSGITGIQGLTGSQGITGVIGVTGLSGSLVTPMTSEVDLGENAGLSLDAALSADGKYSGITESGTAGAALAFGELCYLQTADSRWEKASADNATAGHNLKLGICVLAAAGDASSTKMLLFGKIRADSLFPTLTIGAPVYMSTTTGAIQVAAPSGTTDIVRIIGYGNTADELYFHPSNDFIELV